ncbi:unnamed protein product [Phytomonas sp. Hart1]|nr:unnamed protein product [Phytomonas sp. Hart1]|eukprot:CCW67366.1 unnamed protein product [Phytomonas sp. isolate Hart1]
MKFTNGRGLAIPQGINMDGSYISEVSLKCCTHTNIYQSSEISNRLKFNIKPTMLGLFKEQSMLSPKIQNLVSTTLEPGTALAQSPCR